MGKELKTEASLKLLALQRWILHIKKGPVSTEPFLVIQAITQLCGIDTHKFTRSWTFHFKSHHTICLTEKSVVFTATYIHSRVKVSTTLTHQDVTCNDALATETFYT